MSSCSLITPCFQNACILLLSKLSFVQEGLAVSTLTCKNAHCYILCILLEIHSLTPFIHFCCVCSLCHWQDRPLHLFCSGTPAAPCFFLGLTQAGVYVSLGGPHVQRKKVKLFPFHLCATALSHRVLPTRHTLTLDWTCTFCHFFLPSPHLTSWFSVQWIKSDSMICG